MSILLLVSAAALAYANGANDNFKGVATLFGSHAANYRRTLNWACWTTLAGSIAAVWVASGLLQKFSGKGLVAESVVSSPAFLVAVGTGAAVTVLLASWSGLPVSTTHALTGALLGAGLIWGRGIVSFSYLGSEFLAPLLFSPLIAIALCMSLYLIFRAARLALGIDKESCICVGETVIESVSLPACSESVIRPVPVLQPRMDSEARCRQTYLGDFRGVSVARLLDAGHFLSAGTVSFARGLNDAPKIAAILVAGGPLGELERYLLVALFIALGGWISARRVAETMSLEITPLNPGQGFSANLATSLLVIGASGLGMPVSTTHVSAGSLFGIGLLSGGANKATILSILLAWIITLPLAALSAAGIALLL